MMDYLYLLMLLLSLLPLVHTRPTLPLTRPTLGPNNLPLFQGDIVMNEDIVYRILQDNSVPLREKRMIRRLWRRGGRGEEEAWRGGGRGRRAAVKGDLRLWGDGSLQRVEEEGYSYGVIPYRLDGTIEEWKRELIQGAMSHWENTTRVEGSPHYCVKFLPWSDQPHYLNFLSGEGCWSKVGKMSTGGPQDLALGVSCGSHGLITHEIGHALGFFHEQSRPDRDDWVKIIEKNVKSDRHYNFIKYGDYLVDSRNVDYDYKSIMHYALDAFSKNGRNTLEPLRYVAEGVTIGQREGPSEGDVEQVRRMYGCVEYNTPTTQPPNTVPEVEEGRRAWYWDFRKAKWRRKTA